jgi:hypothetical protein
LPINFCATDAAKKSASLLLAVQDKINGHQQRAENITKHVKTLRLHTAERNAICHGDCLPPVLQIPHQQLPFTIKVRHRQISKD